MTVAFAATHESASGTFASDEPCAQDFRNLQIRGLGADATSTANDPAVGQKTGLVK